MILGVGSAGHHHGEILQGATRCEGKVVPCLITMPVGGVGSRVRYVEVGSNGPVEPLEARGPAATQALAAERTRSAVPGQFLDLIPALKTKAGRAAGLALA